MQVLAKFDKQPFAQALKEIIGQPDVHRKAALAAKLSGKSLNQWAREVLGHAAE